MAGLISVIVTTYSREDALAAVLRALSRQTDPNFEVVVADDGSGPATAELVEAWKGRLRQRLVHVWHEDRGFRAAEIRNRAILAASGDYCVFLDGDCIARPDFVAVHRRLAEPGLFVTGNRVLLSPALTARVLRDGLTPEAWGFAAGSPSASAAASTGCRRCCTCHSVHCAGCAARLARRALVQSCGVARRLERVDGFDADYSGWGKEDSDFIVRLLHAGVRRKDGVFATGVLHLWHAEADRSALPANERKLSDMLTTNRIQAWRGLSALKAGASAAMAVG